VLSEKLTQQPLVRARLGIAEWTAGVTGKKAAQRIAYVSRQHAARRGKTTASLAERAACRVTEEHRRIALERVMTLATDVECRSESQLGDDVPRAGECCRQRFIRCGSRKGIERVGNRIEKRAVRRILSESQRQLGNGRRAGKAAHVFSEHGPRTNDIESTEGVKIATRLRVELRGALREEVERAAEAPRGAARPLGKNTAHSAIARDEAKDARGLEVVEGVENNGVGGQDCHDAI